AIEYDRKPKYCSSCLRLGHNCSEKDTLHTKELVQHQKVWKATGKLMPKVMEGFVGSGRHFTKERLETIVPTSDGTGQMNGWQEVIGRKTERSNQKQDVQGVLDIKGFNYLLNTEEIDNGAMEVEDEPD
ncbi:hypothetical protein HAX54_028442, partial [Datura stramonium]|nr:hypothetical protein [Datura stramonium]